MSGPNDAKPDEAKPPENTPSSELGHSIKDIFGAKPKEETPAPAAQPETPEPDTLGVDDLLLEETELATMEDESPSVAREQEVATEEPQPVAEATATPAAEVAPPAASTSGVSNDLEEETYAPTVAVTGPQAGEVLDGYHLNEDMGRGWFTANPVGSGPSVDVFVRPNPLWAALKPHRMLPKFTTTGSVTVLEPTHGEAITPPLDTVKAQGYATELARLLFALEKQGYAVTDLDPTSLQVTADGLKLRLPPKVARLGEQAEAALRDGFTAPEVDQPHTADARSGVYVLGAMLYRWLTGQTLPPEGATPIVLAGINSPGMPQLLNQMLSPLDKRLTPTELLDVLKTKNAPLPAYQIAAGTNIGLNPERPVNEDSYGFVWRQVGMHGQDALILRAVVSDGMGGMAAGEVASQAAVRAFLSSDKHTLTEMVWDANAEVLQDMAGRDGGCTISAVEIVGGQMQLGHVGDTRAYLRTGGEVTQISKDHSYVAAMVASGQMTPEQAQVSPERNKVLRSLGSVRVPQANYVQTLPEPQELKVGDRILLVSDGVWGEVEPPILHDILLNEPALQEVVDRLLKLSLDAGAPDNITALVIERVK